MNKAGPVGTATSELLSDVLAKKSNAQTTKRAKLAPMKVNTGLITIYLDLKSGLPIKKDQSAHMRSFTYKTFDFHVCVLKQGTWFQSTTSGIILKVPTWINGPLCQKCKARPNKFRKIDFVRFLSSTRELECTACRELHKIINIDEMSKAVTKELYVLVKQSFGLSNRSS